MGDFVNKMFERMQAYSLTSIRQDPSVANFEAAEKILQTRIHILTQQLPKMDILVTMATEIKQRSSHKYLLTRCK